MKRAISYLRFSSLKQSAGRSENRQTETAEAYCTRKGWTLDATVYADRGVSGLRGLNASTGRLGAFLTAITEGKVKPGDVLIVESLDRLSRQEIDEAFDLFRGILKTGVEIVTLDPERHYDKSALKSITGIIEPLIIMARANEESETKSGRIKDTWVKRRAAAHEKNAPTTSNAPTWLTTVKVDGKVKHFVPNVQRVAVVKRIFGMAIEGQGCSAIARTLNKEGVEAFGGGGKRKAALWTKSRIGRLLRMRSVLGEYQPQQRTEAGGRLPVGSPILNHYPEVIDPETFWRAQGIIDGRKQLAIRGREGKDTANLFTGLTWCARTGSRMLFKNTAGKYLVSADAIGGKVKAVGFKYPIFEESVLLFLKNNLSLQSNSTNTAANRREATEAELASCEKRMTRTQATMASADDALYASLAEVLATQTKQKTALTEALNKVKAEEACDPQDDLRATQSFIVSYFEAVNAQDALGALMDETKLASKVKPTAEVKALEEKIRAEHWGDLRAQIKSKLRALLSEIWVKVTADGWRTKTALVEMHFRNDGVKAVRIHTDREGTTTQDEVVPMDLKHLRFVKIVDGRIYTDV